MHCFGHRHEVAGCSRIGDKYRFSLLDLFPEKSDDTSAASRNISKAHVRERFATGSSKLLNVQLRQFLGQSHITLGAHRFIRGDIYKPGRAALQRRFRNIARAQHVVAYCFLRMQFEKSDMLMRCGMENNFGPLSGEELPQAGGIKDIGKYGPNARRFATLRNFAMHIKQAVFGLIEQDDLLRRCLRNLAAEFRTDASSGSGDQNHFSADNPSTFRQIYVDLSAIQKVRNLRAPQLAPGNLLIGQLRKRRERSNWETGPAANSKDVAHLRR